MPSVVFGTLGKHVVCRVPEILPTAKLGTLGNLGVSGSEYMEIKEILAKSMDNYQKSLQTWPFQRRRLETIGKLLDSTILK